MISETAAEKILVHQKCMKLKEDFGVKDFFIYNVRDQWGYGISKKPSLRTVSKRYKPVNNPITLSGTLERMAGNTYKVWYIDEDKEFDSLNDFLEYYYITKLAGI